MQLDEYTQRRDITWTWIKAHQSSDNVDAIYNNMADELATSAIKR
jgi:ribonuclease HI